MRRLDIGIGLIYQRGAYHLQLRGNDPRIGAAGKIGAFGGKVEPGETPAQAACRELNEETNLELSVDALERIGDIVVTSDHRLEPVEVHAGVFCVSLGDNTEVRAKEGTLITMTKQEALEAIERLTPATRNCFEQLL